MDMGAGGWVWAAARDRITRLVCRDIDICKHGERWEWWLKSRRVRWASCMPAVAHMRAWVCWVAVLVLVGSAAIRTGYKVCAWDAAFILYRGRAGRVA